MKYGANVPPDIGDGTFDREQNKAGVQLTAYLMLRAGVLL
jgi:hypothetical protein